MQSGAAALCDVRRQLIAHIICPEAKMFESVRTSVMDSAVGSGRIFYHLIESTAACSSRFSAPAPNKQFLLPG